MLYAKVVTHLGHGPFELDIARGEIVSLGGPSGVGKSLLLRAIADLDPNDGDIRLNGVSRNDIDAPQWRRRVGYLAARPGWWEATVGAHFPPDRRETAKALLPRVGLETSALNWDVERLSSGERQRLALVRMLVNMPDVLLLDEPTAALDHETALNVEALLHEYAVERAILCVTHDAAQASRFAVRRFIVRPDGLRPADRNDAPTPAKGVS